MKRFESYDEALKDALQIDPDAREIETGKDFGSLPPREAENIVNVHATGGGMWTWCYQRDMAD